MSSISLPSAPWAAWTQGQGIVLQHMQSIPFAQQYLVVCDPLCDSPLGRADLGCNARARGALCLATSSLCCLPACQHCHSMGAGPWSRPRPSTADLCEGCKGTGLSCLSSLCVCTRNGIYPLMNFAVSRPHALPRALSQPQEDPQKAKTPTPEPFDVETRKVRSNPGGDRFSTGSGWTVSIPNTLLQEHLSL